MIKMDVGREVFQVDKHLKACDRAAKNMRTANVVRVSSFVVGLIVSIVSRTIYQGLILVAVVHTLIAVDMGLMAKLSIHFPTIYSDEAKLSATVATIFWVMGLLFYYL